MLRDKYNSDQIGAFNEVVLLDQELQRIEGIREDIYLPVSSIGDIVGLVASDLFQNDLPLYHVVDQSLKVAISRARDLGIGEDDYIREIADLVFS